jgi:heterodisulfide reductase subunit A
MSDTKKRVGVYVCHCGGNISDVIDVKKLADGLREFHDVEISREFVFMCSDAGQKMIIEDIKEGKVNCVVVAACSPALHELTFRKALQRAGLNPFLYEHVNIREQCSWVHKKEPEAAAGKAELLIRAGVEKVIRQDPLESIMVEAQKRTLVVGGGPAGMRSAIALADRGLSVALVERNNKLGGRLSELETLYPTDRSAAELRSWLETEVNQRSAITTYLADEVAEVTGFVGNFDVTLKQGATFKVGAIILATGSRSYQPFEGEFGYRKNPNVVTLPELNAILEKQSGTTLSHNGRVVRSVAFIHCVGSRQKEGVHTPQADGKLNEYCSRVCCSATLHSLNRLRARFPDIALYDLYRDIRTYARHTEEGLYEKASRNGVTFFRYTEDELPKVEDNAIIVRDVLTWNEELEVQADLIVLATGLLPTPVQSLVEKLKLPVGADRFLLEAHPKLRPVEVANNGMYLAGTCQAPMDLTEASAAAAAASSKAAILLGKDAIALDPYVANVREDRCDGCKLCLPECSYSGAIVMNDKGKATVNAALCKGCGACVAVCPTRALDLKGWSLEQIEAMVDAIAEA